MKRTLLLLFIVGFGMAGLEPVGWSQPLPQAQPEAQGLSAPRLQRMHRAMQRFVDDNLHAGIITLIARDGKIVDWQTFGHRDRAAQAPMEKETICRIYSMTKIVTTTAVLMLFEEGRIGLDDPIGDYIPELENPKVMTGGTADDPVLVEAESPVTITPSLVITVPANPDGDAKSGRFLRSSSRGRR